MQGDYNMINSNHLNKKNITTEKEFLNYFNDMITTIFNAQYNNLKLVFNNEQKFEIKTYLD